MSMTDSGSTRTWQVDQPGQLADGPLVIVESKTCSIASTTTPRLTRRSVRNYNGLPFVSTKYLVTSGGCELEFLWPENAEDASPYLDLMRYAVFVGDIQANPEALRQLYKVDSGR
jgi:hypothetical protein